MTLTPSTAKQGQPRRPIEMGIEGVRGVAALFVALSHVLCLNLLTPDLDMPRLLRSVEAGQAGVLVFFVLSGYVITWTNSGAYTDRAALSYVRRRFVRLAPIYMVAMILTLVVISVSGYSETLRVKVGSFLGLQNFNGYFGFSLNPPRVNGPLWSLNYELLYYGLFLVLWRFKPKLPWIFGPALLVGVLGWFLPRFMPLFIASYGCGWLFWAAGWWLASQPEIENKGLERDPLASWVLLILANYSINGVMRVLNVLHFYSNDSGMVSIADLGKLPIIMLVLASVGNRKLPHRGWIEALAWVLCLVPIAGMVATGRLASNPAWVVGTAAVVAAALLRPFHSNGWLRPLAWFGGISYAFYVVHFPLLYLLQVMPLPRATAGGFVERLILWIILTLGLSWFLEKRFQPWIKRRLMRRPAQPT